jgi:hypothetical protein
MALDLSRFESFCSRLPIRDRDTGRTVPFRFAPSQQRIMASIREHQRPNMPLQVILYKSRRTGGSTWAVALLTAHNMAKKGGKSKIVAQLDKTAKELYEERAQPFAAAMRRRGVDIKSDKTEIRYNFADSHYSTLGRATAKTVIGGRGLTASALLLSEASYYPGEESFVSMVNTVSKDPDNIIVIETTPNGIEGPGQAFYNYWHDAVDGVNGFIPIFMPWHEDPGFIAPESYARDSPKGEYEKWLAREFHCTRAQIAWYRLTMAKACAGNHDLMKQEFPSCLTAETRVSTELGIVPVGESSDAKLTESGPIIRWHVQPPSPIYKLTTRQGRVLRGTHDHPVMTATGWKFLAALMPGDVLTLRPPRFADNIYVERWHPIPGATTSVKITEDWGLLLGYFMGDGCWYKTEFSVACDAKDQDVVIEVRALMEKLIGRTTIKNISPIQGRKGCDYISARGKDDDGRSAAKYVMIRLGAISLTADGYYKRNIEVPECIWKSPRNVVAKFLSGLFEADGHYTAKEGLVSMYSYKLEFVRSVQLLLLGFGIDSNIRAEHKVGGTGKAYTGWTLKCTRYGSEIFLREIGFRSERKRSGRCKRKICEGKLNILRDEVLSVTPDGVEPTYDFTIEGEAAFSAEGILTHNTPEEGFISSGRPAFDSIELSAAKKDNAKPIARGTIITTDSGIPIFEERHEGEIRVWELPIERRQYYIGADAAKGVGTGDFAAIVGWNGDTGRMAFRFAERIPPETLAYFLNGLGRFYNNAMINIEFTGGWGATAAQELRDRYYYPQQYLWRGSRDDKVHAKASTALGWETTQRSRRMLFDRFRLALRRGEAHVTDQQFLAQMSRAQMEMPWNWQVIKGHDDIFMAGLLGWIAVEQYHTPRQSKGRAETLDRAAGEPTMINGTPVSLDPFMSDLGMLLDHGDRHLKALERINKGTKKPAGASLEGV